MYHKKSNSDLVGEAIIAAAGAGVATTFAVARGQSPIVGLGITAFAAIAAIVINRLF
ncbi:MAG: hypothetical protein HC824_00425 [Synechococcales cyanobacterium RM1_1_8]|nr:hypothetical protein [Synechococcales cyanobacterium RM1_1_8]